MVEDGRSDRGEYTELRYNRGFAEQLNVYKLADALTSMAHLADTLPTPFPVLLQQYLEVIANIPQFGLAERLRPFLEKLEDPTLQYRVLQSETEDGIFTYDPNTHFATSSLVAQPQRLTPYEGIIFTPLIAYPKSVIEYGLLMSHIDPSHSYTDQEAADLLKAHVRHLREKLGANDEAHIHIIYNYPRQGYSLTPPPNLRRREVSERE